MNTNFFNTCKFIDIHYHADPDLYRRCYSTMQAGRKYQQLNGAVVLKSHLGSTAIQSTIAQQEGLPVFPSIVLNKITDGINYRPIIKALSEYQPVYPSKMIVHFPTLTGRKYISKLKRKFSNQRLSHELCKSENIFNANRKFKNKVYDVLKLSKDYPVIISSGHASKDEIYFLLDICEKLNITNLLLNQPANPLTGLTADELLEITIKYPFVWVEQTALTYLLAYQSKHDFYNSLKKLPKLIYSSDLGQPSQIDISQWVKISHNWFSDFCISNQRKEEICLTNPSLLLQI